MEHKHTPGPWFLAEPVENRFQRTDMRRIRSEKEGLEHGAICEVYGIRDGSVAASNACLIAAAPDLLESGRRALKLLESVAPHHPQTAELRAAISKATGEPQ